MLQPCANDRFGDAALQRQALSPKAGMGRLKDFAKPAFCALPPYDFGAATFNRVLPDLRGGAAIR